MKKGTLCWAEVPEGVGYGGAAHLHRVESEMVLTNVDRESLSINSYTGIVR